MLACAPTVMLEPAPTPTHPIDELATVAPCVCSCSPESVIYVIVALQDIPEGSPFMGGFIGRREWPMSVRETLPADTLTDEAQVISQTAKINIVQGQLITRGMLNHE